jgi:uncharacterized protein (DUF1330 family)
MKKLVAGSLAALTMIISQAGHAQDASGAPPLGYMIANYDVKDQAGFQRYMDAAGSLAANYNGRVIVFNRNAPAVESSPKSVIAIAEFPSVEHARRFYNSPEYTAARQFRIASTEGSVIITEGLPQQ